MPEHKVAPVSATGAATSPAASAVVEPKASLAAASAIGSIARILGKLSEVDQKKVISAISELK